MPDYPRLILHAGKERSLKHFHPWVFSGAIKKQPPDLEEGAIVEVFSATGEYLATGHFHKGTIVGRILTFEQREITAGFWLEKLEKAFEYRKHLGLTSSTSTNVYRLVHGEGDGLPGLIIDIYKDVAVLQAHTLGMYNARQEIGKALLNMPGEKIKYIYDKSSEALHKQNVSVVQNDYLFGSKRPDEELVVFENSYSFAINYMEGQKTGFFIDQRDNRLLLSRYSKDKNVLNTFCYTGGFSVYALAAEAKLVHSVDSSKRAIADTDKNVALNFKNANHESFTMDVADYLRQASTSYDVVVLDPPAFAKHLSAVKNAMVGYRNLNCETLKRIAKGGILFTFSCSQAVDKELFRKVVFQAAAQANRTVRIMHQLSQPADHPVSIYHPEGEYLKGLVLYVE